MGKTFVTFVLDETGSMQPIKDDTIGGFNEYVRKLKESPDDIAFTLIKFDSNHTTKVHVGVPVKDVVALTPDTYRPGASTPLIDAVVKAVKATDEKVASIDPKPNVLVAIQTDGYENASVEYKNSDLNALIKEKTAAGWQFVFLGAGIDAFDQAMQMGIAAANTVSYDRDTSAQAFAAAADNVTMYARTGSGASVAWSAPQRASTGGHMPPPVPTDLTGPAPTTNHTRTRPPKTKPQPIVDDIKL